MKIQSQDLLPGQPLEVDLIQYPIPLVFLSFLFFLPGVPVYHIRAYSGGYKRMKLQGLFFPEAQ
jgi:hypothetical protein